MALKKLYYSVGGEIIAEKAAGGQRVDYLTDALGSVTGTVNQSAQVVNTYRYKPYGAQLAKTGAGADPTFRWVGQQGYRQTNKKWSDVYVRARHYDPNMGRWTTSDPFWPDQPQYAYSGSSPVLELDNSGLWQIRCCCCPIPPLSIKNVRKIDQTGPDGTRVVGHHLEVHFKLKYTPGPDNGLRDCKMSWRESTSDPYSPFTDDNCKWKGEEEDLFTFCNKDTDQRTAWRAHDKPCPKGDSTKPPIVDEPTIGIPKGSTESVTEWLHIKVTITSDPKCKCKPPSVMARFDQSIKIKDGIIVEWLP